jgi:hypothetical protein
MAYHPQTDRQSKWTNQLLEQYLHLYCATRQNKWAAWLPLAQYTYNLWPSAMTRKMPFDTLIGYTPRAHQPMQTPKLPGIAERLESIKEAWQATQEALCKAQDRLIAGGTKFKPYTIGTKVWLEGTNLNLPYSTRKMSPKRYGPFNVAAVISPIAYQLKLPTHWKVHLVFHASLLTPYKEMEQHGPNFLKLPPEIIEGEPEWEVEKIISDRTY